MSAFMVDKEHIDAIMTVAVYGPKDRESRWEPVSWYTVNGHKYLNREGEASVGCMLIQENLASIHARYPDTLHGGPCPGPTDAYWERPYSFQLVKSRPTIAQTFKLLDCYEYQSCEHEEWETSEAHSFCQALRKALWHVLPGYEQASWEWGN